VRRYIASGELPAVRVGRQLRLEREAVDRFITPVARPAMEPDGKQCDQHVTMRVYRGRGIFTEHPITGIGYAESELAEVLLPTGSVFVPIDLLDDWADQLGTTDENDALWRIVGIGGSEDSPDVATNKHKYLADAVLSEFE
jgi:hypothetical protein